MFDDNVNRDFWQHCDELLKANGALVHGYDALEVLVREELDQRHRPRGAQLDLTSPAQISESLVHLREQSHVLVKAHNLFGPPMKLAIPYACLDATYPVLLPVGPRTVLTSLYARGARSILLSGDRGFAEPFVQAGAVDEIVLYFAVESSSTRPRLSGNGVSWSLSPPGFESTNITRLGSHIKATGVRTGGHSGEGGVKGRRPSTWVDS